MKETEVIQSVIFNSKFVFIWWKEITDLVNYPRYLPIFSTRLCSHPSVPWIFIRDLITEPWVVSIKPTSLRASKNKIFVNCTVRSIKESVKFSSKVHIEKKKKNHLERRSPFYSKVSFTAIFRSFVEFFRENNYILYITIATILCHHHTSIDQKIKIVNSFEYLGKIFFVKFLQISEISIWMYSNYFEARKP